MLQNVPGRCSLMERQDSDRYRPSAFDYCQYGPVARARRGAILSSEARTMHCLGLAASMQPPGGTKMPGSLEHKIPPQARHRISDKNLLAKMTIATQLDITSRIT